MLPESIAPAPFEPNRIAGTRTVAGHTIVYEAEYFAAQNVWEVRVTDTQGEQTLGFSADVWAEIGGMVASAVESSINARAMGNERPPHQIAALLNEAAGGADRSLAAMLRRVKQAINATNGDAA